MSVPSNLWVNAIYPAFQGEQNFKGIGAPVLFLRLQGCHLRCYHKTMGVLCDTPEGLEREGGTQMHIDDILETLLKLSIKTGIKLICLSGGDPLWNDPETLHHLFKTLGHFEFEISVETSGTLSMQPFRKYEHVHWVLDYKVKSAGIKQKFQFSDVKFLNDKDFIKFVLFDEGDYQQFKAVLPQLAATKAVIAVGNYWGGQLDIMPLYNKLVADGLAGKVVLNVQLHKLATFADTHHDLILGTTIPAKI